MKLFFESTKSTKYVVHPHKLDMDLYDIVFNDDHSHAGNRAHTRCFDTEQQAWDFIKRFAKISNWLV